MTPAPPPTTAAVPLAPVLAEHATALAAAGVPSPHVDTLLLTAHVLGLAPGRIRAGDAAASTEALARLAALVAARARRIPLQQLTGEAPFRELTLECAPGVFVPRPETEIVAGIAIELARRTPGPLVVDACTGSGAIALSVAVEVPRGRVVATERAPHAVALARRNLDRVASGAAGPPGLATGSTCEVVAGDLLDPLDPSLRGCVDVLVSNPPYLSDADLQHCEPEVAQHDPRDALAGGPDGYEVVRRLVAQAAGWLAPGGWLVVEVDDRRGAEAVALAHEAGLVRARVEADLTGRDRALVAMRAGVAS